MRVKKLHPEAVIPKYAKTGDSGFDLVAVEDVIIEPGETAKVPIGLAFEIPAGFEIQIRPRSGVTAKTKLRVQLGTVDAGYRGEVSVVVDNIRPQLGLVWTICEHLIPGFSKNTTDVICYVDGTTEEIEDGKFNAGTYMIRKGDRIAQGVIAAVGHTTFVESDELNETERGTGGFGSTGY